MTEYLNNSSNISGLEMGMVQMNYLKFQSILDHFKEPVLLETIRSTVKYHLNYRIELLKNTNGAFDKKMNLLKNINKPIIQNLLSYMIYDENYAINVNELFDFREENILEL